MVNILLSFIGYTSKVRECGEIGRHDGLKIRCLVIGVRVQVPPFPVYRILIYLLSSFHTELVRF